MTRIPTAPHFEIEPLSDRGWERVEDAVFAQLDRADRDATLHLPAAPRPARWRPALTFAGVAAVAAAAAAAVLVLGARDEGVSPPLHSSRVETADAPTRLTHGEASLAVAADSALVLSGDDERGLLVVLERGRVECSVPPRRGRPSFAVQAGDVRVQVIGTRFAVSREENSASVEVIEGTVEVIADGESTRVHAGERWPAPRTAALEPDAPEPEPVPEPEPEVITDDEQDSADEPDVAVVRPRRVRHRRTKKPTPAPTAQQRYNIAASLEAKDPDAASKIYGELARGSGAVAANALYARADLELVRGHRSTARQLLREYLKRFPDGPHAADARELLKAGR